MNLNRHTADIGDPLDALLRESACTEYIEDAGFTARVIQSLPRRQASRPVRAIVLIAAFLISCLIGIWALPPLPMVISLARFGIQDPQFSLLLVFIPVLAAVSALGWILYALATEET